MSASQSLYRKYRSSSFDELVGQEPVVRTLKNAITNDRIAQAYLFTGPRGVGKTSAARLLARAANCTADPHERPCNRCPNCLAATRDIATDLIEIDAASNTGVDNIRDVIERAQFAPSIWHTKFYIIDEVHMLSMSAFNALLKTLEEPPPHTSFILATTEVHKVPATVASRCQRFDFRRIPLKAMLARLQYICGQEGIKAERAALELIARQSTGSLRDALSLLDQLQVFAEESVSLATVQDLLGASGSEEVAALVDTLLGGDMAQGLRRINSALEDGLDLRQVNRQVVEHLRSLLLVKSGAAQVDGGILDVTEEQQARLHEQAERVSIADLLRWIAVFSEADSQLRSTVYGQLPLEMALVEAMLPAGPPPVGAVPVPERHVDVTKTAEAVGALPPSRVPQRAPGRRAVEEKSEFTGAPPPIHSELESIGLNGSAAPAASVRDETIIQGPQTEAPADQAQQDNAATPALAAGEDELERLKGLWADVVDQIRARSKSMASVYGNAVLVRPVQVEKGVAVISFRDPIYAKKSATNEPGKEYRDILEAALSRVLGYRCRAECITFAQADAGNWGDSAATGPDVPSGKRPQKAPPPHETSRGRAAMNIFNVTFEDNE